MAPQDPVEAARARFQAAGAALTASLAEVRAVVDEMNAAHRREKADERYDEKFQEAARAGDAGAAMGRVQEKVDRGDFTWDQAFTGQVDDEFVRAAVRRALTPLREGLDEETGRASRRSDQEIVENPLGDERSW